MSCRVPGRAESSPGPHRGDPTVRHLDSLVAPRLVGQPVDEPAGADEDSLRRGLGMTGFDSKGEQHE